MIDKLTQACNLLGIKRVFVNARAYGLNIDTSNREMWFGPKGEVIGYYTPDEGLAKLKSAVAHIDQERTA